MTTDINSGIMKNRFIDASPRKQYWCSKRVFWKED